jgi:hypothetical protein
VEIKKEDCHYHRIFLVFHPSISTPKQEKHNNKGIMFLFIPAKVKWTTIVQLETK